ncbi:MarR family winged helix-turn-helix transcriptional regulator [Rhodovastum atsumiense]|uniref:MarR family winged helix-turn-helix transcriptional regulator n=1 Tax=Rhodovastum atsumiense TaxID=504468 RepID=UPI00193BA835|nr:MarR family transcriptional regulator [Rhodovastum atsumiense]
MLLLEEFLPFRLVVLASSVGQGFTRLYTQRFGVGLPEWRVIAMLGQHGTLTSKAVGERTFMHKTMVSRAVSDLERDDLVVREPNRADKREVFLSLSEKGQRVYAEIVPLAREYATRLTADLTKEDLAALDRIVAILHERSGEVFSAERRE